MNTFYHDCSYSVIEHIPIIIGTIPLTADIHTREPRCDLDSTSNIHIPVDGNGKLCEKTRCFDGIKFVYFYMIIIYLYTQTI